MAYDLEFADRLRDALAGEPDLTEKRMFGGLAFLVDGRMAVCAGSQSALMLRVDPAAGDASTSDQRLSPMVMRGRELRGWLTMAVDASVTDEDLNRWVEHSVAYARSLPSRAK